MQSVVAQFTTDCQATVRIPVAKVEFQWDGSNWLDESAYFKGLSGDTAAIDPLTGLSALGSGMAAQCVITLRNPSGRFSRNRTDAALYAYIGSDGGYMTPVRVSLGFTTPATGVSRYVVVFTGYIVDPSEQTKDRTIVFTCHDNAARATRSKQSCTLQQNVRSDAFLTTLKGLLSPVPSVSFDIGQRLLPFAWADDENVYAEMKQVAEAEGGRIYYDELGVLRFENATHLLFSPHTVSQWTFTVANMGDLKPKLDLQNVVNEVIVNYTPRYIGGSQVIYQSQTDIVVPPSSTITFWAVFSSAAYDVTSPAAATDYNAYTAANEQRNSDVAVTIITQYAQRVEIQAVNSGAIHTLYLRNFQLRGQMITGTSNQGRRATADDGNPILKTMSVDNFYIQAEAPATALAAMLKDRLSQVPQIVTLESVPGVPQMEVLDRVTITEAFSGINRDFFVIGIRWAMAEKLTMSLDLLDAVSLFASAYTNFFLLGTTKYGGSGVSGSGRIFY
jgi:hypothetical protein